MKYGSVTKLDKRNNVKKNDVEVMSANYDVLVIFPIYGQFEAIRKPDSGRTVCKTFSLTVTCYLTKTENRTKKFL